MEVFSKLMKYLKEIRYKNFLLNYKKTRTSSAGFRLSSQKNILQIYIALRF